MSAKQQATDHFRNMLITVVGGAFGAAGYQLDDAPVQQNGGLFRFRKPLNDGEGRVDFQLLYLPSSEWSGSVTSRFRVTLSRTGADPVRRTLPALVVEDFGVAILPSADHWWQFSNTDQLGNSLAESGHLVVGYGLPWLAGDLQPGDG